MNYQASGTRYDQMAYRRCGNSGLNDMAQARGQSLAQMATAWVLRDPRVTSALIGASSASQITELVGALDKLCFSPDELDAIDQHAVEGGINLWNNHSTRCQP